MDADGGDQKEGRFVMNSPLSELADQSIPMSRISALPVARNLRITALVEYNLVQQYIYGSAISIWLNIKCNGSPMQMWWFGTEVVCNSLQKCGLWDNSDRGTTSDTGLNHMSPWHPGTPCIYLANNWHWHPGTGAISTK